MNYEFHNLLTKSEKKSRLSHERIRVMSYELWVMRLFSNLISYILYLISMNVHLGRLFLVQNRNLLSAIEVEGLYRKLLFVKSFFWIILYHMKKLWYTWCICVFISLLAVSYWGIHPLMHDTRSDIPGHITLYDRHGNMITLKGLPWGFSIAYTGSLEYSVFADILRIEDQRYYRHMGIDLYGKIGSIRDNMIHGSIVRGWSTITEQYIKNRYYPYADRTYRQKVREAIGAIFLELFQDKDTIYRGYLDTIYFWKRIYGIQALMSTQYSYPTPKNLSENEISDIITRIKYPNITEKNIHLVQEYKKHITKKLGYIHLWDIVEIQGIKGYELFPQVTQYIIQSQKDYCKDKKDNLNKILIYTYLDICHTASIHMTLSIDRDIMRTASILLEGTLEQYHEKNITAWAIYIYDAIDKKIRAYISNRKWKSIDMIQRARSAGSILKPFVYLLALEHGAEIESLILDESREYPTGVDGKIFVPQNYIPKSYGPVTLKESLWNSLNTATVRITEKIWLVHVYDFLKKSQLDITMDIWYYGYGLSLWNIELSLANIVESYGLFLKKEDPNIFLIGKVLSDPNNRARTFGRSSILNTSVYLPVKTGTSTDFRDNWVVSYSDNLVIWVWMGNEDGSPMYDVSGVSGAGPLWHKLAEYLIERNLLSYTETPPPMGIYASHLCLDRGCRQQILTYLKNTGSIQSLRQENIYYKEDFFDRITTDEKIKWNIQ